MESNKDYATENSQSKLSNQINSHCGGDVGEPNYQNENPTVANLVEKIILISAVQILPELDRADFLGGCTGTLPSRKRRLTVRLSAIVTTASVWIAMGMVRTA